MIYNWEIQDKPFFALILRSQVSKTELYFAATLVQLNKSHTIQKKFFKYSAWVLKSYTVFCCSWETSWCREEGRRNKLPVSTAQLQEDHSQCARIQNAALENLWAGKSLFGLQRSVRYRLASQSNETIYKWRDIWKIFFPDDKLQISLNTHCGWNTLLQSIAL